VITVECWKQISVFVQHEGGGKKGERGRKEGKIRENKAGRKEAEKEMLENGFFANLAAIKILSHRYPSFVLGDFQTQIKYYLPCPHNGWLLNLLLKRQYGFRAWIRPRLFFF